VDCFGHRIWTVGLCFPNPLAGLRFWLVRNAFPFTRRAVYTRVIRSITPHTRVCRLPSLAAWQLTFWTDEFFSYILHRLPFFAVRYPAGFTARCDLFEQQHLRVWILHTTRLTVGSGTRRHVWFRTQFWSTPPRCRLFLPYVWWLRMCLLPPHRHHPLGADGVPVVDAAGLTVDGNTCACPLDNRLCSTGLTPRTWVHHLLHWWTLRRLFWFATPTPHLPVLPTIAAVHTPRLHSTCHFRSRTFVAFFCNMPIWDVPAPTPRAHSRAGQPAPVARAICKPYPRTRATYRCCPD